MSVPPPKPVLPESVPTKLPPLSVTWVPVAVETSGPGPAAVSPAMIVFWIWRMMTGASRATPPPLPVVKLLLIVSFRRVRSPPTPLSQIAPPPAADELKAKVSLIRVEPLLVAIVPVAAKFKAPP